MESNILTKFQYERLFESWKQKYGVLETGKKGTSFYAVPSRDPEARTDMYRTLIKILVQKHGYTSEDFTEYLVNLIIDTSVPEEHENKKKLKNWRKGCRSDFDKAFGIEFPDDFEISNEESEKIVRKVKVAKPVDDIIKRPEIDRSKLRLPAPVIIDCEDEVLDLIGGKNNNE